MSGPGKLPRPEALTADDILPLVASLTLPERVRLLRLIASPQGADAPVYRSVLPILMFSSRRRPWVS